MLFFIRRKGDISSLTRFLRGSSIFWSNQFFYICRKRPSVCLYLCKYIAPHSQYIYSEEWARGGGDLTLELFNESLSNEMKRLENEWFKEIRGGQKFALYRFDENYAQKLGQLYTLVEKKGLGVIFLLFYSIILHYTVKL